MLMRNPKMLVWMVLALMSFPASWAVAFGPGEAVGGARAGQSAHRLPGRGDFVVLVWYRRNDPLGTFQHQVYDLRRGEYTEAVEAWIHDIRTKYPAYLVLVRPVDLSREAGQTEQLKVGSVIHRELLIAAAAAGVFVGQPLEISSGPSYSGQGRAPAVHRMPAPDRSFLNPPPTVPEYPVYPRLPL
jgi:hypothetical protein